jgi:hypothetical protein
MSNVRALACVVVILSMASTRARADSVTVTSSGGSWTFYISGGDPSTIRRDIRDFFQGIDGSSSSSSAPATPAPAPASAVTSYSTPYFAPVNSPAPSPAPAPADPSPAFSANNSSATPILAAPIGTSSSSSPTASPAVSTADAYINFNPNNLPEASQLTVGTATPWYTSPAVIKAFGGNTPTADQQAQFVQDVKNDVIQTYALAGMHPVVTLDPSVKANHTISVASGLSYGSNPNAIGITDVGQNGFGFIDKLNYATDEPSLAWAVAHNISHELMHAFGLSYHPDQTGTYIDAATANWNLLTNPNTTFSPGAVAALTNPSTSDLGVYSAGSPPSAQVLRPDGDLEIINAPEPTTIAGWAIVLTGAYLFRRHRVRAAA